MRPASSRWEKWLSCGLVLAACAVFVYLRAPAGHYDHPDEIITARIVEHIFATGVWDTNWALADLPENLKYDQYNFSSYIVASAAIIRAIEPIRHAFGLTLDLVVVLRILSAAFHIITILLTYAVGRSLFDSRRIGVAAAWLVAAFPLMFQDSLYARPESFATMLTMLVALLIGPKWTKPPIIGSLFIAMIIGFLVACKITFVVLLALPAIAALKHRAEGLSFYVRLAAVLVIGLAGGFALGAPYAVVHFSAWYHGLVVLFQQYSGVQRPFGLPDGTIPERLAYSWQYFAAIGAGLFAILAVFGWLLLLKARDRVLFLIMVPFVFVIVYFSTRPVFFERNFGFAIPFMAICAASIAVWTVDRLRINPAVRAIVLACIVIAVTVPMLRFMLSMDRQVFSGRHLARRAAVRGELEKKYGVRIREAGCIFNDSGYQAFLDRLNKYPRSPLYVYEFCGANDPYTRHYLKLITDQLGMRMIAELPSPFEASGLPPSTLYTYHALHYYYFGDAAAARSPAP
jgi:hypothetical protein